MKSEYGLVNLAENDEWWALGHIDEAEATLRLREYLMDYEADEDPGRVVVLRKCWARWVPGTDDYGDPCSQFYTTPRPGRGAFPVSLIEPWKSVRRRRAREAWGQAQMDLFVEACRKRWPEAQQVEPTVRPAALYREPKCLTVRMTLPGLAREVTCRADRPEVVYISHGDIPAWERLYGKGRA